MLRSLITAMTLGVAAAASAQTTTAGNTTATGTQSTALSARPPAQNVTGSAVAQRAPGTVVNAARARHNALRDSRLQFQQSAGQTRSATTAFANSAGSTAGSITGNSTLDSLLSSVGLTGLGSLDLGTLTSLLGGTSGLSGLTGTTGSTTGGSTTTNPNIPSNLTPAVIAALEAAGIDINALYPPPGSGSSTGASTGTSGSRKSSGTNGSKTGGRAQTATTQPTTTDHPGFAARWADAMVKTLFTGIVVGLQTPDFINLLERNLRPILNPDKTTTTDTTGGQ